MIYKAPKSQKESGRIGWWTLLMVATNKQTAHQMTWHVIAHKLATCMLIRDLEWRHQRCSGWPCVRWSLLLDQQNYWRHHSVHSASEALFYNHYNSYNLKMTISIQSVIRFTKLQMVLGYSFRRSTDVTVLVRIFSISK